MAAFVIVVCGLPLFLIGALAVQVRDEFEIGVLAIGVLVAAFRTSGAISIALLGRSIDRFGASASMRVGVLGTGLGSGLLAALAHDWATLLAFACLLGIPFSWATAAVNAYLTQGVKISRQGSAFGIKQSAMPLASVLAGLAVPGLALTVGWRWAFAAVAVLAVVTTTAVEGSPVGVPRPRRTIQATKARSLYLLAVGFSVTVAAASNLTAFMVDSSVTAGFSPAAAGLLLTIASLGAVVVRIVAGRLADRRGGCHLRSVVRMLAFGVIGYLLLASGNVPLMSLGAVIALGFGWGYNGVFWIGVLGIDRGSPGRATSIVLPGGLIGGVLGPLGFGALVDRHGYRLSWLLAAVVTMVGMSVLSIASGRELRSTIQGSM